MSAVDPDYFSLADRTAGSLGLTASAHDTDPFPPPDRVGAVAVHPDDDPADPRARRYLLTDESDGHVYPWDRITGNDREDLPGMTLLALSHAHVEHWPRQSLPRLAVVLGHGKADGVAP